MRRITSPRARLFCVCARNRSMRAIARRRVVELSWWLQESKRRFQWAILPIPRSQKQLSISISGCSANQNADSVSLPRAPHEVKNNFLSRSPDTPRNQKRISISIPRHYAKRKTNLDFDFRVLWKQKMNCYFAFRVSGKPKMNLDLRLRTLSEAKNELLFCFQSVREAKNESRFASPDTQ